MSCYVFARKEFCQTDTNDYTVVSFPYVLPEKEDGRGVYVDPSTTRFGNILTHESHRVRENLMIIQLSLSNLPTNSN